ncbi:MAG: nucleotidyltransferase family protein [Candidatus Omnitrophica bacterium]|nr:nucleotidyltransferase family protein [Candidatus Omnitrophota bacterium]
MKALILAAGYATRLYPLTKEYPKPLLLVKDRPIIDYIVDKISEIEAIDEIIVVTNSKFILKFKAWKNKTRCPKQISIVDDLTKTKEDRRGAIGDMDFLIREKRVKDDLLVIGGDNIFDEELSGFMSFAKKHEPYPVIGVYDLRNKALATDYGVIKLDKRKQIVDFKEKPEKPGSSLIAMCLYFFPKQKLGLVKEYMDKRTGQNDAIGLYIDWLRNRESVYGFVFNGAWFDIGHLKTLKEAKQSFPTVK